MNTLEYSSKSRIQLDPEITGWHFIDIGVKESVDRKIYQLPLKIGISSLPVKVTLGKQ